PGDSNNGSDNTNGSVGQTASTGVVVAGTQASAGTTPAVPTAVAAGVTGEQDSGSTLGGLMILLGVATMFAALVHRRSRA
ncbi:MAG TPA: hypothetical protein VFY58_03765, partial [Nocardioides sp.]|nr:hypothetical protein [Nocardioides sp.]